MREVESWLASLGLEQYVDAFRENAIDFRAVPELTEDDLKELGLKLGHRRVFQQAVRVLAEAPEPATASQAAPTNVVQGAAGTATERRQLSVMFCDLQDSVALGERMDIEDYRNLLTRFRTAAVAAVEQFGGFVARHQGDGLLVYFGFPSAHENDAERAVRAGLAVVDAVHALEGQDGETPAVRVGIATGATLVGDLLETGGTPEFAALGSTPNLAARLQGAAAPDSVVISSTTRSIVAGAFDLQSTDPLMLKGFTEPVIAHVVGNAIAPATETAAGARRRRGPLVGRDAEFALMSDRWDKVRAGTAQTVLISAEPGVGKSRLVYEMRQRVLHDQGRLVAMFCSPYHTDTALFPVLEAIRHTLQERAAGTEFDLTILSSWLEGLGLDAEPMTPLLAPLLSIRVPDGASMPSVAGGALRRQTLDALVRIACAQAQGAPLLMVTEDLHWADPTTLELLDRIIDEARDLPLLTVLTYRPEFVSPWTTRPRTTSLTLSNLTPEESRRFVAERPDGGAVPDDVVEAIVARTDGVPLFIEELARTLTETDAPSGDIPATLRDALAARLDRLGPARTVAQLAAVVGRQFSRELIAALASDTQPDLDAALERLLASGLVHRRRAPSGDAYEFKHALVRDAAYDSLLRDQRRALHARLLAHLESAGAGTDSAPLELLAQHARAAEHWDAAYQYARDAGLGAAARGANAEAIALLDEALAANAKLSAGAVRERARLELIGALRGPLHALGRNARLESELNAGLEVAQALDDRHHVTLFNAFLSNYHRHQGSVARALASARTAHSDALAMADQTLIVCSAFDLAQAELAAGDVRTAATTAALGLEHIGADDEAESFGRPAPAGVLLRFVRAEALSLAGEFDTARAVSTPAIELADRLCHPFGQVAARHGMGSALYGIGEFAAAFDTYRESVDIARAHGIRLWLSISAAALAEVMICSGRGRADDALALARESGEINDALGYRLLSARIEASIALALSAVGEQQEAEDRIRNALRIAPGLDARSEVQCGWIAASVFTDSDEVRRVMQSTRVLAEARDMRPLAARCALRLAELGDDAEALDAARAELVGLGMAGWLVSR